MPLRLDAYELNMTVRCARCQNPVPINGFTGELPCPHCQSTVKVGDGTWRSYFDVGTQLAVLNSELGQMQNMTMQGRNHVSGGLGHNLPRCLSCARATPLEQLGEHAAEGGYSCDCGSRVAVREATPLAREVFPGARWLVGERLDQQGSKRTKPIVVPCQACGASLEADGSSRTVDCAYCSATNFLPDALWAEFHPTPTMDPYWVVLERPGEDIPLPLLDRLATSDDWSDRQRAAPSPHLSPERMRKLATDSDSDVREALARNPRLDEQALRTLAQDHDYDVRMKVAGRKQALPSDLLEALLADSSYDVRKVVVRRDDLPLEGLVELARTESDSDVLRALQQRRKLDPRVLEALASNEDGDARKVAACHPSTPPEALQLLIEGNSHRVMAEVAANPAAGPETLNALASNQARAIRDPLSQRDDLPTPAILALAKDVDPEIQRRAMAMPGYTEAKAAQLRKRLLIGGVLFGALALGGLAAAAVVGLSAL
jgi:DNA-directed RNA polymerase subunit RPC12/RpoP